MKKIASIIIFTLFLVACMRETPITPTILPTETKPPTLAFTASPLATLTKRFIATPTGIPGILAFWQLEGKVQAHELYCSELIWADVGLEITTGSVQPFIIRRQHAQPGDKVMCNGFFVIPDEPGEGYFIYHDQAEGIKILGVTFDKNDIINMIAERFRNTTPTPSD